MSIPVALADLPEVVTRFRPAALLVTTASDGPPHLASVVVAFEHGTLTMRAGWTTRANAEARPDVALVWPGATDDEYCLIVDGIAIDASAEPFAVRATSAVLHRLATEPA
jgi:hypothetical protein